MQLVFCTSQIICDIAPPNYEKLINKPEEEWIRVEGTHEPIISREVWDTVVSIDKKKVRKTPPTDGIRSIFTGLPNS